jgi:hypothetical protein
MTFNGQESGPVGDVIFGGNQTQNLDRSLEGGLKLFIYHHFQAMELY